MLLFEKKVISYDGIVFFMAIAYSASLSFIVLFAQKIHIGGASI